MSKLDLYSESFKATYEKFIIGCDSQEEIKGWDICADGEMEGYYSNILITVVMKLIASDSVFSDKEVEYFNKVFGFEYSVDELKTVYENCEDVIEENFSSEIVDALEKLEGVNEKLASAYKELLGLVGCIISASDGIAHEKESKLIELLNQYM